MTDYTVADLMSQLGGEPDARGLEAALRVGAGDPSLVLGYYVASRAGYVDDTGTPLGGATGRRHRSRRVGPR